MPSADPMPEAIRDCPDGGLTRRHFLVGAGLACATAVTGNLVTTRVAYGAPAPGANTVVVVFLRGGADGLRILAPHAPSLGLDHLRAVRDPLVPREGQLIPLEGGAGWALNQAMRPLYDALWERGELAFVPAVSAPGVTRSHFQAERHLEVGGRVGSSHGWLDRVLAQLTDTSPFSGVATGVRAPISMVGEEPKITLTTLEDLALPGTPAQQRALQRALGAMYAGTRGPLGADVASTLAALSTAAEVREQAGSRGGPTYPAGPLGKAMRELASVLLGDVGLRVATVDVGGWDTHSDEVRRLDACLTEVAAALTAFMADLGAERRRRVTVVVQSEFGRRVAMNVSGGADHGTGGLIWLLGGGVAGQRVHGRWRPLLGAADLADGDVPMLNNAFDVLGEVVQKRLGLGSLSAIFPGHSFKAMGVVRPG